MAKPLVSDELWQRIEPLLPQPKPRRFRFPGRKPLDYRKVLTGIIFVLKTGIPWEQLPQEMGCGCGMTCLNYLNAWQRAGVWEKLHQILLAELEQADKLDCPAPRSIVPRPEPWGAASDRPQSDGSSKPGTKHHVLTEGQGVPLVTHSTGPTCPTSTSSAAGRRHPAGAPRRTAPAESRTTCTPTGPTTHSRIARSWSAGLIPTWRGVGPNTAVAWGSIAGWRSDLVVAAQLSQAPVADHREGPVHDAFVSLASALICMWFL